MSSLAQLWEDSGFLSKSPFWDYVKEEAPGEYTKKEAQSYVDAQESVQVLSKRPKTQKFYNSVTAVTVRDKYQTDVMIYDRNQYGPYKYILGVIDVFSRYAQCEPITSREFLDDGALLKALKKIIDRMGVPNILESDNEFNNKPTRAWASANGIEMRFSDSDRRVDGKNAIIERYWGTLAQRLAVRRRQGYTNWPKDLGLVVKQLNKVRSTTTKEKSADIWQGRATNRQVITRVNPKLQVGDIVRILLKNKTFRKGDAVRFSKELYTIAQIEGARYLITDADTGEPQPRLYLEKELQAVPRETKRPEGPQAAAAARAERKEADAPRKNKQKRAMKKLETDLVDALPTRPRGRRPAPRETRTGTSTRTTRAGTSTRTTRAAGTSTRTTRAAGTRRKTKK
jgi:hypothetical protein